MLCYLYDFGYTDDQLSKMYKTEGSSEYPTSSSSEKGGVLKMQEQKREIHTTCSSGYARALIAAIEGGKALLEGRC